MTAIDTLKLARALRDKGGFSSDAAEATAEALNAALGEEVATKADLRTATAELKTEFAELKTDFAELKGDFAELKAEIAAVRSDLGALKWQVGIIYAFLIAILIKLFMH